MRVFCLIRLNKALKKKFAIIAKKADNYVIVALMVMRKTIPVHVEIQCSNKARYMPLGVCENV